jgi:predicted ester cyclase
VYFMETSDTISWQRTLIGTHKNSLMGIPASLKKVQWNEMVISKFKDNKITEEWVVSELAGVLLLNQS